MGILELVLRLKIKPLTRGAEVVILCNRNSNADGAPESSRGVSKEHVVLQDDMLMLGWWGEGAVVLETGCTSSLSGAPSTVPLPFPGCLLTQL